MPDSTVFGRFRSSLGHALQRLGSVIGQIANMKPAARFLRRHAYLAAWIQGIVVVPAAVFAASQYYFDIQRTKSINTLNYIEMSFSSEELVAVQVGLDEKLRAIYEASIKSAKEKSGDIKQSFWHEFHKMLKDEYRNNRRFSADVNAIFSFVNAVHHCIESDLCNLEPLKTIYISKDYYVYLHAIAVCHNMPRQDEIIKKYYTWLGYDPDKKLPAKCLA